MKIAGVDFSGAAPDNNTWLAQGWLSDGTIELESCARVSRAEVAAVLEDSPDGTVASLDFPFSVPRDFAEYWISECRFTPSLMPGLWRAAAEMDYTEFLAMRDSFVVGYGESKRLCDRAFPECYSCLHKANPNMVPMTFRGMQMLDSLWGVGCDVPPLPSQNMGKAVLLEAMPGAALRALGLHHKGYKNGVRALELRRQIISELPQRSGIAISNLGEFEERCLISHDCLDSVVAAVTAALWATDPGLFWRPEDPVSSVQSVYPSKPKKSYNTSELPVFEGAAGLDEAIWEGWLYAPVFIGLERGFQS